MKKDRWQRVEEVFHAACELKPAAREEFLQNTCAGDPELLEEVRSLLEGEAGGEDLLVEAVGEAATSLAHEPEPQQQERIGSYRIERKLGQGGMGAVYLAIRDDDQYRKKVALKVIRRGLDASWMVNRFRHERQILASLEHPHIARLLDGGSTSEGLPYIVMEYVEGEPITEYCTTRGLDVRARLNLFQQVCSAVSYAHRKLIIHRDLKPGNILASESGGPRLLDFGTAKLVSAEFEDQTAPTQTVASMLTPDYASPEQLRGEAVSTATDVYSLGVILYELLTGRRPYETEGNPVLALERMITGEEPAPPSHAPGASDKLSRLLKGDLDRIVLMAMRREPERRYASVEQFSEDIQRYLDGLPIRARPDTLSYRASKFIGRNKLAVAAIAAGLATLIAGAGIALWQAREARIAARRAEQRFTDVRALSNTFLFDVQDKLRTIPGTLAVRKTLVETAQQHLDKLSREADGDPGLQFELASAYDRVGRILGNPAESNFGNTAQATDSAKKAIALFDKAIAADPGNEAWLIGASAGHRRYAELLNQTNTKAARAAIVRAVEVGRRAMEIGHTKERLDNLRAALLRLSEYQRPTGENAAALQSAEEALAVSERLAKEFSGTYARRSLALSYCAVGTSRYTNKDRQGALQALNKCQEIREAMVASGDATPSDTRNLALTYLEVAQVEMAAHPEDTRNAARNAEKGLRLLESTAKDAGDARAMSDQATAHARLATALRSIDQAKAIHHLQETIRIRKALRDDPANLSRLSVAHNELAEILIQKGQPQQARSHLDEALGLNARVLAVDPHRKFYLSNALATHGILASVLIQRREFREAAKNRKAAIEIALRLNEGNDDASARTTLADAYTAHGRALEAAGDRPQALDAYRKSFAVWSGPNPAATATEIKRRDEAASLVAALEKQAVR
jgi:tetratricopeptide (TPR) repeat protein/tRNA A-37 threonylcarbamoyl transferase component Bud32